jgi:hypothetical protein
VFWCGRSTAPRPQRRRRQCRPFGCAIRAWVGGESSTQSINQINQPTNRPTKNGQNAMDMCKNIKLKIKNKKIKKKKSHRATHTTTPAQTHTRTSTSTSIPSSLPGPCSLGESGWAQRHDTSNSSCRRARSSCLCWVFVCWWCVMVVFCLVVVVVVFCLVVVVSIINIHIIIIIIQHDNTPHLIQQRATKPYFK